VSIGRHTAYRAQVYEESPWYAPIAALLAQLDTRGRFPTPDELSALHRERVEQAQGLPALQFVEAPRKKPKRPKGQPIDPRELYEGQVTERGQVPTRREDWHDLFNALAFITFPRAKRALHARQYTIMKARLLPGATRLPNARTREQDALSLFDEGGLIVAGPQLLHDTLVGASDETLAAHMRSIWLLPFGHALYEHMVAGAPCPLATAHVLALEGAPSLTELDAALALSLGAATAFVEPNPARGNSLTALTPALRSKLGRELGNAL
jgi:Protein of unknown function (DUF3025)